MATRKPKAKQGNGARPLQEQPVENSISVAPVSAPGQAPEERRVDQAVPAGAKASQNSLEGMSPEPKRIPERSANKPPPGEAHTNKPVDTESLPAWVRDRYVQFERKLYSPAGEVVIEDHGTKLTTKSHDPQVARDMFDISAAREYWGQNAIVVQGSDTFRRAVWEQAKLAGIEVQGYEPTKLEVAALVQGMARRAAAQREESGTQNPPKPDDRSRQPDDPPRPSRDSASPQRDDRVIRGKLVDHGPEHFNYDPREDMSYFVKVKTADGKTETLWGLDLERALAQAKSGPKKGDEIVARQTGREPVTVTKVERDHDGRVTERPLATHKNHWEVETTGFADERMKMAEVVRNPKISAQRAVEMYPALAGTYGALKEAELYAQQEHTDPKVRQRWQSMIREGMARDIARGEPLVTTRVRADLDLNRQRAPGPGGPTAPDYAQL
jgi:putative DNA primase/helicase